MAYHTYIEYIDGKYSLVCIYIEGRDTESEE